MTLKILKLHSPKGSCNFENFQNHSYLLITNCTRGRAISYTNAKEVITLSLKDIIVGVNSNCNDFLNYCILIGISIIVKEII